MGQSETITTAPHLLAIKMVERYPTGDNDHPESSLTAVR